MGDIFEFKRPDSPADFALFTSCFPFLVDPKLCALAAPVVCRALEVSNVNTAFGCPYRYFAEFCAYFGPERVRNLQYSCLVTVLECFGKLTHECAEYLQFAEITTLAGIVD